MRLTPFFQMVQPLQLMSGVLHIHSAHYERGHNDVPMYYDIIA
ncbi:hypothetical protein [Corynebacterium propinquum]|nr:hypothetical protein [Corynebacterium propinquum]MDK4234946.1 hypothetical protein [Corynebacterium propinquum]